MKLSEIKPLEHTVKYYETDAMAVVHHSNYIRWFEEARVHYLNEAGFPYSRMEELGVLMPVLSVECEYKLPFRFDERAYVTVYPESFKGFRMTVTYTVTDEAGAVHVTGRSSHCFTDRNMKPIRVKKDFPEMYSVFEELFMPE